MYDCYLIYICFSLAFQILGFNFCMICWNFLQYLLNSWFWFYFLYEWINENLIYINCIFFIGFRESLPYDIFGDVLDFTWTFFLWNSVWIQQRGKVLWTHGMDLSAVNFQEISLKWDLSLSYTMVLEMLRWFGIGIL